MAIPSLLDSLKTQPTIESAGYGYREDKRGRGSWPEQSLEFWHTDYLLASYSSIPLSYHGMRLNTNLCVCTSNAQLIRVRSTSVAIERSLVEMLPFTMKLEAAMIARQVNVLKS